MGNGEPVETVLVEKCAEPAITQFTGSHFNGNAFFCSIGPGVETGSEEFDAVGFGPVLYECLVSVAVFAPQREIHVGNGKNRMQRAALEQFCQTHGVDAAADSKQETTAFLSCKTQKGFVKFALKGTGHQNV